MNTVKVVICDDSTADIQNMTMLLQKYARAKKRKLILSTFMDGQELLRKYQPVYDVIFIDIRMSGVSGDILAEKIRKQDRKVPIVFVSSYLDAVFRGYELNIQNYMRKPINYEKLSKEMDRAFSTLHYIRDAFFWEKSGTKTVKIYHSKLEYIETGASGTRLHYDGGIIESHKKLKAYEQLLSGCGFYRCNYSFIVNLRFISRIIPYGKRYDIILLTGANIPLSRGSKKECMEQLISIYQDFQ